MNSRRIVIDLLSLFSLFLVLGVLTWIFDVIDLPVARWISASTGGEGPQAVSQGYHHASQILNLMYMGMFLLAGFVGGKFVKGRALRVRVGYLLASLLVIGALWAAGKAGGVLVPVIMAGHFWPGVLLVLFLSTGWAYGSNSIGQTSDAAWRGASAGNATGGAGAYLADHHHHISDIFH